jgi:hypothetical protein
VANTSANDRAIRSTPRGSTFVNLRIYGQAIEADVAPNTRVNLPGIGYVLLKSVDKSGDGRRLGAITVDMITVVVTQNNSFGLPIGARVVVADAVSGFSRNQPQSDLGGQAYAATAVSGVEEVENRVGKAAFIFVGCEGTDGKVRRNNVNSLGVEGVLTSGTGTTMAFGKQLRSGGVAKTTSTVEDANLLGGLIQADLLRAVANDTLRSGRRTSSAEGTRFVNLTIAGQPVSADVPPNTRIDLPGVGYVIVNEQRLPTGSSGPASRTQVNALHVFVGTANTLGLPVDTELIVAHADTTIRRF